MKLRIYEPGKTYLEGEVVVRLKEHDNGDSLSLQVMKGDRCTWYLLSLFPGGVHRTQSVVKNSGFPLDDEGRLVDLSDSPARP